MTKLAGLKGLKVTLRDSMMEEVSFWRFATLVFGLVSLVKGVRPPARWAATQALVNYDYGIVKRGLLGATFGQWFHMERYSHFAVASYVLLALFCGLFLWFSVRCSVFQNLGSCVVATVFFASFAVTYIAHLVGYFDIPLGVLTLALLFLRQTKIRFVAAVPVGLCALLIHDSFLLTFFPVLLFSFVLDGLVSREARLRKQAWLLGGLLFLLAGVVTMRLAYQRPMTKPQADAMMHKLEAKADFPIRADYFEVHARSIRDNVRLVTSLYHYVRDADITFLQAVVVFSPTIVLLLIAALQTVRANFDGRVCRIATIATVLASLSPLLMNIVGWDTARWDALTCVNAFLVFLLLLRAFPAKRVVFPGWYLHAAILAIGLSMASGEGLMDSVELNSYPFMESTRSLGTPAATHYFINPPKR